MDTEKLLKNQRRQERRGLYERSRRRHFLFLKNSGMLKLRKQSETKKIGSNSIWTKIKFLWRKKGIVKCWLGFHQWNLMSGPKGSPKYMCRRCLKYSKKVW